MPKPKQKEIVYFDNYDMDGYEAIAREALSEDGSVTPDELDVRDVAYDYAQEDWDDLETRIDSVLAGDNILVCGSIGRWNGSSRGYEIYPDWRRFIAEFGKDCDYFKVYSDKGHLYVRCSHHDGNNFCEIKRLTPYGLTYFNTWDQSRNKRTANLDWYAVGKRLFEYRKYSSLINLADY